MSDQGPVTAWFIPVLMFPFAMVLTIPIKISSGFTLLAFIPWTILPSFPLPPPPPTSPVYEAHCTNIYRYRFTEASTYIYIHAHARTFLYRYIFQFMLFIWSAVLWTSALTGNLLPDAGDRVLRHSVLPGGQHSRISRCTHGPRGQSGLGSLTPLVNATIIVDSSRYVRVWSHRHGGRGKPTLDPCPLAPCDVQGWNTLPMEEPSPFSCLGSPQLDASPRHKICKAIYISVKKRLGIFASQTSTSWPQQLVESGSTHILLLGIFLPSIKTKII